MSASYQVTGFVLVKIPIDDVYSCSQSSTHEDIAGIVNFNLESKIGSCKIIEYGFKMERID